MEQEHEPDLDLTCEDCGAPLTEKAAIIAWQGRADGFKVFCRPCERERFEIISRPPSTLAG